MVVLSVHNLCSCIFKSRQINLMPSLLTLPTELRIRIYEFVACEGSSINIAECCTFDQPRTFGVEALATIDQSLFHEIMQLFWSINTFEASRYGRGYQANTDRLYRRWLQTFVCDDAGYIKNLRFRDVSTSPSGDMIMHGASCVDSIDIDVKHGTSFIRNHKSVECTCFHARVLRLRIDKVLMNMPKVNGKNQATTEVLWDLYESWYLFHPIRNRLRSWEVCQLQFEMEEADTRKNCLHSMPWTSSLGGSAE